MVTARRVACVVCGGGGARWRSLRKNGGSGGVFFFFVRTSVTHLPFPPPGPRSSPPPHKKSGARAHRSCAAHTRPKHTYKRHTRPLPKKSIMRLLPAAPAPACTTPGPLSRDDSAEPAPSWAATAAAGPGDTAAPASPASSSASFGSDFEDDAAAVAASLVSGVTERGWWGEGRRRDGWGGEGGGAQTVRWRACGPAHLPSLLTLSPPPSPHWPQAGVPLPSGRCGDRSPPRRRRHAHRRRRRHMPPPPPSPPASRSTRTSLRTCLRPTRPPLLCARGGRPRPWPTTAPQLPRSPRAPWPACAPCAPTTPG